jgi:hypothetical protein
VAEGRGFIDAWPVPAGHTGTLGMLAQKITAQGQHPGIHVAGLQRTLAGGCPVPAPLAPQLPQLFGTSTTTSMFQR